MYQVFFLASPPSPSAVFFFFFGFFLDWHPTTGHRERDAGQRGAAAPRRGNAIMVYPQLRLDNLRACHSGAPGINLLWVDDTLRSPASPPRCSFGHTTGRSWLEVAAPIPPVPPAVPQTAPLEATLLPWRVCPLDQEENTLSQRPKDAQTLV
jgi:hypothetical protein